MRIAVEHWSRDSAQRSRLPTQSLSSEGAISPCSSQILPFMAGAEAWETLSQLWAGHEEHSRNLEDDIGCVVAHIEVVELVPEEREVLLESANIGIADIGLV